MFLNAYNASFNFKQKQVTQNIIAYTNVAYDMSTFSCHSKHKNALI